MNRRNFDLIPMDTGSMHMAISGEFDKIVRPKLREYDHGGKAEFLSTSKYHERTPGLLAEFQGKRMITLTIKCYYANDGKAEHEISFKGVRKKQNSMSWERYLEALNGSIDTATNMRFRPYEQGIVTYTQDKLGLSACYDKRIVDPDGIHTKPLR